MSNTISSLKIRPAHEDDWPTITEFNIRLAAETESKLLDPVTVEAGVQALLKDARKGRYFLACVEDRIIGQLMHTFEWSDWRNGEIWWLQSVYVHPDFRRQGVFGRLNTHLEKLASEAPGVVGLRLYVELQNEQAQQTYLSLGMTEPGYRVMEQIFD